MDNFLLCCNELMKGRIKLTKSKLRSTEKMSMFVLGTYIRHDVTLES